MAADGFPRFAFAVLFVKVLEELGGFFRAQLARLKRLLLLFLVRTVAIAGTGFRLLFRLLLLTEETKLVFISLRGEIEREFTINKGIIEDGMILPAGFSLSVFNTPISSATLAFGLKGGYSVLYPSKNDFSEAFKAAVAPVLAGTEKEIILVYADELVPEMYGDKRPEENIPLAFACVISSEKNSNCVSLDDFSSIGKSPSEFLRFLLK